MIIITVDNRVRIHRSYLNRLTRDQIDAIKRLATHQNPDYQKWERYRKGPKPPEYIRAWKEDAQGLSLPRGREQELLKGLVEFGLVFKTRDQTTDIRADEPFQWNGPVLWDAQRRLIDSYQGDLGVWRSPPGSGKTCATLKLISLLQRRTLIVCPTEAIFKQWLDRSKEYLGAEPGILKGSKRIIRDITIAMQQTLYNCAEEYANEFGFVIVDEGQKAASKTYQDVIDVFSARYRLTVTGDERRADGKEFLIYDQFGTEVEEVTKQECLDAGTLVDTDIIVVETDFKFPDYVDLPPDVAKRVRSRGGGPKDYARALAQHRFSQRPKLDEALYKDQSRNALVVSIARRCLAEGQHVVCLSTRREHCLILDAMLSAFAPTVRFMGDDEDFEQSRDRFAKGEVKCAVGTYKKIGVGFEACRELGRGILAIPFSVSGSGGRMEMAQFTGRFARAAKGKQNAKVYYLHDVHVFGDKPVKLFKSWYKRVFVQTLQGKILPVREYLSLRQQKERNATQANDDQDDGTDLFRQGGFGFE